MIQGRMYSKKASTFCLVLYRYELIKILATKCTQHTKSAKNKENRRMIRFGLYG